MDDTKEVHVEHVEHIPDDPAEHVVDTAAAAVALAEGAAASAELQAAERVAEVERDADEWKLATQAQLAAMAESHASLSATLNELSLREAERRQSDATLNERLSLIESRLSPSNPNHSSEAETEAPIVGAEAGANLGPAEVSGEASLGNPTEAKESEPSRPARKHRWI